MRDRRGGVIRTAGALDPPADRLLAAAAHLTGDRIADAERFESVDVLALSTSSQRPEAIAARVRQAMEAGVRRVLVLGRIGTHRDAGTPALRALWDLEELARASGAPVLTLRVGPVIGPASPLWGWLARRPRLPRRGMKLVNPVSEDDAVETLRRALAGEVAWQGWYEVAGPETWTLAELADAAASSGTRGAGHCEPPMEEIEEHRLAEAGPWLAHFALAPRPLAQQIDDWRKVA